MSGDVSPRLATEADYAAVVDLLERVFGYDDGEMPTQIPNWFDDEHPERYAVVERDGEVVSTVGCLPQTFVVGDDEVEWWGVGNVATAPAHRGNGYMTALLEFWLDRLREESVPLAELGGATRRYNRFGWENAGRECVYSVNYPAFAGRSGTESAGDGAIRRYDGTRADRDLVTGIHRAEPYRVRRSDGAFDALLCQRGIETLLYEGAGGAAYLSFNRETPSGRYGRASPHAHVAAEFGGSETGLAALLDHLHARYGVSEIGVPAHPTHERADFLRRHSGSWSMGPHRMVRILDLAGVLEGFAGQLAARWRSDPRSGDGETTLAVEDADGGPVTVRYGAAGVAVERTPGVEPDVALDRLAMTQFLFGFPEAYSDRKAGEPFLDAVLPLDFYIWLLEGP